MFDQAILNAILGGALIGSGALPKLLWNGKIDGISGITKGLLHIRTRDWGWPISRAE